jgi:uncharacterized protein YneF (UPF0154 family)
MSTVSQFFLSLFLLVVGFALGVFFILWLLDRKSKESQEQVDLTDRKQIENMMGVFGHKPSQEQVNRFIASIKKKKGEKPKRKAAKEE